MRIVGAAVCADDLAEREVRSPATCPADAGRRSGRDGHASRDTLPPPSPSQCITRVIAGRPRYDSRAVSVSVAETGRRV